MAILVTAAGLGAAVAGCGPLAAGNQAATGPSADPSQAAGSGPLVGSWVTEIVADDLARAGITDPGLVDENTGRFTFTFHPDGTWEQLQESLTGAPVQSPVWKGTWTLEEGVLTQVTTFPPSYAGDVVTFSVTVDRDSLTLRIQDPPDPILPVVTGAHPWERVGP
jgi:hypothetical protein